MLLEFLALMILQAILVFGWRYSGQPVSHPYLAVDSAVYLSGAASIASGGGYAYAPLGGGHPIGFYPPGQSAYLSPFWAKASAVEPYDYRWLWGGQTLLGMVMFSVAYVWFRTLGVPRLISGLLIANVAWSPVVAWVQIHLYSDTGFALFAIASVLLWRRYGIGTPMRQLAVGCCIGLSILWRTPGIALLGACAVSLAATPGIRSMRTALILLTPGFLAVIWPKLNGGSGDTYGEALGRHFSKVIDAGGLGSLYLNDLRVWMGGTPLVESTLPILNRIPPLVVRIHPNLGVYGTIVSSLLIWLLVGVTVLGVKQLPRQQQWVLVIGTVAYTILVVAIPMPPLIESFSRYMFPLATLFLPFAYLGTVRICPPLGSSRSLMAGLSILLGSLALQGLVSTRGFVTATNKVEVVNDFRALAELCRDQLPPEEKVAVGYTMPVVDFWRLTGRILVVDPRAHSGASYLGPSHIKTGSKPFAYRLESGPPWTGEDPLLRSPLDRWRIYPGAP
jgi:hypothetical protein